MSYKEKDTSIIFPTRFGQAIGTSRERVLLDNARGGQGIIKRVRDNPDGSTTRLVTRAGMPHFSTEGVKTKLCWMYEPVLDSGFVDTTYNYGGVSTDSGGKLQYLVGVDGLVKADDTIKLRDSDTWKERFSTGVAGDDGVAYWGLPSNFSGLMRRLMQVQHSITGKKARPYEPPPGAECPHIIPPDQFSCRYVKTHGLFISSTGKRWVIEVSSEGVFRIPIDFLLEFSSPNVKAFEQERMAALVTYDAFEAEMKDYWMITRFKHSDKVKIADAPISYAKGYVAWYFWCGWAFDYTGGRATIALSRTHPSEPTWHQAALFDMTIAESTDGSPSYVAVTKSDESILATNINDYADNENAFIQCATGHPGVLETVGLFSPVDLGTNTVHAPMFSYFTEAGEKKVFYFDRYGTSAVNTTTDNRTTTSVTVSRTGDWTIGNFYSYVDPNPSPPYELPAEYSPMSYQVTVLEGGDSGLIAETLNGTSGGWCGFSGAGLPNQNVDYSGTRSYTESVTLGTGFVNGTGISLKHVSRLTMTNDVGYIIDNADTFPGPAQTVEAVSQVTCIGWRSAEHSNIKQHWSTLILPGYDRESMVFCYSVSDFHAAHTMSADGGTHRYDSSPLYSRYSPGTKFSERCETYGGGTADWCFYASFHQAGGEPYIPSRIKGWYDVSVLNGKCVTQTQVYKTINTEDGYFVTPTYDQYNPASTTVSRTLYVHVGDTLKTMSYPDNQLHRTYLGGAVFLFWTGASAFTGRGAQITFYSELINQKPKVENLSGYPNALKSLFGFVGVF